MGGIQRGPHLDVLPLPQVPTALQLGSEGPGPPRPPFRDELIDDQGRWRWSCNTRSHRYRAVTSFVTL